LCSAGSKTLAALEEKKKVDAEMEKKIQEAMQKALAAEKKKEEGNQFLVDLDQPRTSDLSPAERKKAEDERQRLLKAEQERQRKE
jgi:hypothetical protein